MSFLTRLAFACFFIAMPGIVWADCSALASTSLGTGKTGEIAISNGTDLLKKMMYCDGTNWIELPGSPTATACTKVGEISLVSNELYYCSPSLVRWAFDSSATTNGTCTKSGEIQWNTGTSRLEFCNGTNWRVVSTADNTADTISGMSNLTNTSWASAVSQHAQVTGFSGGNATVTFNTSSCPNPTARVCTDNPCAGAGIITTLTADGTMYVPNGAWIRFAYTGPDASGATCSISATVGGQTITTQNTTAATDTTVTYAANFTTLRSQTASALVTSNIVRTSGDDAVSISITDVGTGGSPEYRTCADNTCSTVVQNWGSAAGTLGVAEHIQLRTTMGADTQTLRTVRVDAGTGGSLSWYAMTSTCPATTTLTAGQTLSCTCPNGYQALGGNVYGNLNYRQTSDLCRSALHANKITTAAGGSLTFVGSTAGSPSGTCASFPGIAGSNSITSTSSTSGTSLFFQGDSDLCR